MRKCKKVYKNFQNNFSENKMFTKCGEMKKEDVLLKRTFIMNTDCKHEEQELFSVFSYNILADCHAQRDYANQVNSNNHIKEMITSDKDGDSINQSDGNQKTNKESHCSTQGFHDYLSMEYRHRKIMSEIEKWDGDVVCLQEVGEEYQHKYLQPSMHKLGYIGIYAGREWIDKPYSEGSATYYKEKSFRLLTCQKLPLAHLIQQDIENLKESIEEIHTNKNKRDIVVDEKINNKNNNNVNNKNNSESKNADIEDLMAYLKETVSSYAVSLLTSLQSSKGSIVTIANVHICYDNLTRPDKQCLQVVKTIRKLKKMVEEVDKLYNSTDNKSHHEIICGDFNSIPSSPLHNLVSNQHFNHTDVSVLKESSPLLERSLYTYVEELFKLPQALHYRSAYHQVQGFNPFTSRYNDDGEIRQVDYIYYKDTTTSCRKVLSAIHPSNLQQIPSSIFPSDHISLLAAFNL